MTEKSVFEKVIVVVTDQEITKYQKSPSGYPVRKWKLAIYSIDELGTKIQANFIDRVEYQLHPTFDNPIRIVKKQPFTIIEKGWGEFDMKIRLFFTDKSVSPWLFDFDLNFQKPHYEVTHKLTFVNPKPEFRKLLIREMPKIHHDSRFPAGSSSSVVKSKLKPGRPKRSSSSSTAAATGNTRRSSTSNNKVASTTTTPTTISSRTQTPNRCKIDDSPNYESSSRSSYSSTDSANDKENCLVDYTRLANNLNSLQGEDILEVIEIITQNRTSDMYINDDIDGEFHMDLYSLGEDLIKMLWDFTESRLSGFISTKS